MEDASQLAVASKFYKYTLTQRESNKIEGLLDGGRNVHNVRGGGRVQNAQNMLKSAHVSHVAKTCPPETAVEGGRPLAQRPPCQYVPFALSVTVFANRFSRNTTATTAMSS